MGQGRHCLVERCREEHGREEGVKIVEQRKQMGWVAKAHKAWSALNADWEAAEKWEKKTMAKCRKKGWSVGVMGAMQDRDEIETLLKEVRETARSEATPNDAKDTSSFATRFARP